MRAVGYVRVSTSEQAVEGVSLAAQAVKITAYAQVLDLDLLGIVEGIDSLFFGPCRTPPPLPSRYRTHAEHRAPHARLRHSRLGRRRRQGG
jgi:hypothetical protein